MLFPVEIPLEIKSDHTEKDNILKPYYKPQLVELGDLRALTLGASGGNFDSPPTVGHEFQI